ncbi:MAG: zinc-dependent metalloprotease family protein [Verrucomicrobiaceae bacterium]
MKNCYFRAAIGLTAMFTFSAFAEDHTGGVPVLNSRPGAAYEIYLNVAGFNYDGDWGAAQDLTPGFTPSLNDVSATGTFNATEQEKIKELWAATAQAYIGFDVNITTVDPAESQAVKDTWAAGNTLSDSQRQAYYDTKANFLHTVIGSGERVIGHDGVNPGPWIAGADGVSGIAVASGNNSYSGSRTNFMLSQDQAGSNNGGVINADYIGRIVSHENGHAFGLNHQGDYNGNTNVAEYSVGDVNGGDGSYVPIMGNADGRQRTTWRSGDSNTEVSYTGDPMNTSLHQQNDVARLLSTNAGLTLVDDGIGHTPATATVLGLNGTNIDFTTAKGIIVPNGLNSYNPIGSDNYTKDYFSLTVGDTSQLDLTINNSTDFIVPGQADGVGTLRSIISLYDSSDTLITSGDEATDTMISNLFTTLTAGDYYVEVKSFGGHAQDSTFNPGENDYFDMGAYFLTGSLVAIPEPSAALLTLIGAVFLLGRRRSA